MPHNTVDHTVAVNMAYRLLLILNEMASFSATACKSLIMFNKGDSLTGSAQIRQYYNQDVHKPFQLTMTQGFHPNTLANQRSFARFKPLWRERVNDF